MNGGPIGDALRALAFLAGVAAIVAYLLGLCGCAGLFRRAEAAIDVKDYSAALDRCHDEAADAGKSFSVYEQCAREADVRFGFKSAVDAGGTR